MNIKKAAPVIIVMVLLLCPSAWGADVNTSVTSSPVSEAADKSIPMPKMAPEGADPLNPSLCDGISKTSPIKHFKYLDYTCHAFTCKDPAMQKALDDLREKLLKKNNIDPNGTITKLCPSHQRLQWADEHSQKRMPSWFKCPAHDPSETGIIQHFSHPMWIAPRDTGNWQCVDGRGPISLRNVIMSEGVAIPPNTLSCSDPSYPSVPLYIPPLSEGWVCNVMVMHGHP